MPTPLTLMTQGTLGEVNIGANAAVAVLLPLIAQLELQLSGEFGLGQLKTELTAQLQAALQAQVNVVNPAANLVVAVAAAVQAVASLQAQISAGLTLPTIQVSLAASLKAVAVLQAKLAGIQLLLDLAAGLKLQGIDVVGRLQAALSFGPIALYGATGQSLSALVSQIAGQDYAGQVGIQNSDTVDALFLVSKTPGFRAAASVLFLMPPA